MVNVVAVVVLLVMIIPVYIAQRLAGSDTFGRPSRAMPPGGGGALGA